MHKQDKLLKKRWKVFLRKSQKYQRTRTAFMIQQYGKDYMRLHCWEREAAWRKTAFYNNI